MANSYSSSANVMVERINNSQELVELCKGKSSSALLKRLKVALATANAVLADAEQKADNVWEVKHWLKEISDFIYQAEDVLDELLTEALRRRVVAEVGGYKGRFQNFMGGGEANQNKIERKMENVARLLEHHVKHIEVIGLKEYSETREPQWRQASRSTPDDLPQGRVVGRAEDKVALVDLLLSDDELALRKPVLVSIVGMPGVGKTTLTQIVFQDNSVTEHFDVKIWISAGFNFNVFTVTKAVLQEITSSAINTEDLPSLQVQLKQALSGKRFLLVMDDCWSESSTEWESFQVAFTDAEEGSKIVITTRSEIVSTVAQADKVYRMKLMTDEESWELISRSAFGNISVGSINQELEGIGKRIAEQCKGLPLTARAIASHLRSKPNPDDWYDISKNFSTYTNSILPVLKLSFDSLPPLLKRCFALCSIFPKGYVFDREELMLLWMATDLLYQPRRNKRLEEIGYDYLNDLVDRSFFLRLDITTTSFVIHDLMNDLANAVSGDFCFRLEGDYIPEISSMTRHFSFSRSQCDASVAFKSICGAEFLRTILPFNVPTGLESLQLTEKIVNPLLQALSSLRILSLSHYQITHLPKSVKSLKQLRYLDMSSTKIKELPEFVCTLCNLQTLLLSNCCHLKGLPTSISELINLRLLDVVGTPLVEMPPGIRKLRSLQKLSNFVVGKLSGAGLHELKELSNLRGTLRISELQNVAFTSEAKDAGMKRKLFLDGLILKWTVKASSFVPGSLLGCDQKEVLKMLEPHPNLKTLCIESYQGREFPKWLGNSSFSSIASVTLSSCNLCISLPPLGQLPSVKYLSIENFDILHKVGVHFFGENNSSFVPFQSLQTLKFYGMTRWEEWNCPELEGGIFPCLQKLVIEKCPKLRKKFPEGLPSSTEVTISECPLRENSEGERSSRDNLDRAISTSTHSTSRSEPPSPTVIPKRDPSTSHQPGLTSTSPSNDDTEVTSMSSMSSLPKDHPPSQIEDLDQYQIQLESSHQNIEEPAVISARYSGYISDIHSSLSPYIYQSSQSPYMPQSSIPQDLKDTSSGFRERRSYQKSENLQSPRSSEPDNKGTANDHDEPDMEYLKVTDTSHLMELPQNLQSLHIDSCKGLTSLPESLSESHPSLQELILVACHSLQSFPATTLKTLYVRDCEKLNFSESLQPTRNYSQLEYLFIGSSCSNLLHFPLSLFPKLKSLSIKDCESFKSFSTHAGLGDDRIALESLEVRDCPNLITFPPGGLPTPKLSSMLLSNCQNLRALPEKLFGLTSLMSLFIIKCPFIGTIPGGGFPSNLRTLCINQCDKLTPRVEWRLRDLENLRNLEIEGGNQDIESFPDEGLLPKGLFSLRINCFDNLATLNRKGFHDTKALETMEINGCDKLTIISIDEELPPSLSCLRITSCLLLTEQLAQAETAELVFTIPHVEIDGQIFS